MPQPVRLVATLAAPRSFSRADDAPYLAYSAATRLVVQRDDTELVVQEIGPSATSWATALEVSFPAPWPRRFGTATVSPAGDLAVFAGVHALRAVDPSGSVRWELRHRCWAGCAGHSAFEEYADDRDHRYAGSGSAAFSTDEFGRGRHWRVDTAPMRIADELIYPYPVSGPPTALGDGTWYTRSATENALHVWALHDMD